MFQGWRLRLREAQMAVRGGHLEEASQILSSDPLRQFLPAKRLLAKVAEQMAQRADARAAAGETRAGWHDLESASRLGADATELVKIRQKMLANMLQEVEQYISAGDCHAALARLDEIDRRRAGGQASRRWRQVAERMQSAQRLGRRGRFGEAERELSVALGLAENVTLLKQWRAEYQTKAQQHRARAQQLHQAMASEQWHEVLEFADAILELVPDDPVARDARNRAWEAAGLRIKETTLPTSSPRRPIRSPMFDSTNDSSVAHNPDCGERFILWVDEVGAFLVCLGSNVTLGQPGPGNRVDIPLLADLSRVHATIRRDGEGYLIDPVRSTRVNDRPISQLAPLADHSILGIGSAVQLRFRRPHPYSATARLEFASRHRTQPSVDAVILMAESCLLGPAESSHVVCPSWPADVVICRQAGKLVCRALGEFTVDGQPRQGLAPLSRSSTVCGADFSFTLEPL